MAQNEMRNYSADVILKSTIIFILSTLNKIRFAIDCSMCVYFYIVLTFDPKSHRRRCPNCKTTDLRWDIISCDEISRDEISRDEISRDEISRDEISRDEISCSMRYHVMRYHVQWDIMWWDITWWDLDLCTLDLFHDSLEYAARWVVGGQGSIE